MRTLIPALLLSLTLGLPAAAQTISDEIGSTGLAATEARLAALPAATDEERFALAGVRFLGAVEDALQMRWSVGLTPSLSGLPVFRLPIPENPQAQPFQPAMVATLFRDITDRMTGVSAPLAEIADSSAFGLEIDLADLWFDIDSNGTRAPGEDALAVIGPMLLGWRWDQRDPATAAPVIRFDAADAAWLSAYSHFLAGFGNVLLAYDPTVAITEVTTARAEIDALRGPPRNDLMLAGMEEFVDIAAIVLRALDQAPDADLAARARTDWLAMIADNRTFWRRVAVETDNANEWIPNDRQTTALGFTLPPDTGTVWQGVLSDAEALLTGTRLAPYVWLGDDAGVNVSRLFTDPRPIDVAAWIQGLGALPYLEKGTLVSPENLMIFADMMQGEVLLYMVMLN